MKKNQFKVGTLFITKNGLCIYLITQELENEYRYLALSNSSDEERAIYKESLKRIVEEDNYEVYN